MSSTTTPAVTPRRDGEPEVDLTAYRLVHRAMLADTRDVADLADRVAGGSLALTAARAAALRSYVEQLCQEIHTHHDGEDHLVWPVVAASAGSAVDLSGLTDDHGVIDPLLGRARSAAAALGTAPDDRDAACRLAGAMTEMFALLGEHIAEEERELFPVIRRFVSVADFAATEHRIRKTRHPAAPVLGGAVACGARHRRGDPPGAGGSRRPAPGAARGHRSGVPPGPPRGLRLSRIGGPGGTPVSRAGPAPRSPRSPAAASPAAGPSPATRSSAAGRRPAGRGARPASPGWRPAGRG